eukprot:CAMPEP_0115041004 /NCGR_PEP_ID=MMETSP0216-20121206/45248_1 /TAXON_ID=223996 /ORGANISM="Protocruzia adherens, Strain Boccale" /LENGTH=142 /DNA_ID=CAMNT_0002422517 /DNA_START=9 /DNA_END=437 /DNA_ORIENTATION=-
MNAHLEQFEREEVGTQTVEDLQLEIGSAEPIRKMHGSVLLAKLVNAKPGILKNTLGEIMNVSAPNLCHEVKEVVIATLKLYTTISSMEKMLPPENQRFASLIEDQQILEKIEQLQMHECTAVYEASFRLLETFAGEVEEETI